MIVLKQKRRDRCRARYTASPLASRLETNSLKLKTLVLIPLKLWPRMKTGRVKAIAAALGPGHHELIAVLHNKGARAFHQNALHPADGLPDPQGRLRADVNCYPAPRRTLRPEWQ